MYHPALLRRRRMGGSRFAPFEFGDDQPQAIYAPSVGKYAEAAEVLGPDKAEETWVLSAGSGAVQSGGTFTFTNAPVGTIIEAPTSSPIGLVRVVMTTSGLTGSEVVRYQDNGFSLFIPGIDAALNGTHEFTYVSDGTFEPTLRVYGETVDNATVTLSVREITSYRPTSATPKELWPDERDSLATIVDADGTLKWVPHNLALNSEAPATQNITVTSGAEYTVKMVGSGSFALTGAGTGTATEGSPATITASTTTLTITLTGSADHVWVYRSDLGGMADVPSYERGLASDATYLSTTDAARYLPRREGHHVWDGSAWVPGGLVEPAGTNLLLNTASLLTQNVTVTNVLHTLHFTGTGSVTLSGAATGTLNGTGAGEENRVELQFTPSAGTLTVTVTGDVENAMLETGVQSSYMPSGSSQATRTADDFSMPAALLPYDADQMSGSLKRRLTYADTASATEMTLFDWRVDANNRITITLDTSGANTGKVTLTMVNGGSSASVTSTNDLTPGVGVEARVAWRVTGSDINIALNGTAATAVSTAIGIPDLSGADADINGVAFIDEETVGGGFGATDAELEAKTA